MHPVLPALAEYGIWLAFLNVLLAQLGVPIPSYPVLIVTGALSMHGHYSAAALYGIGVLACVSGDLAWYAAGRRYGGRVVKTVCRISISPDSCVRQTESLFARWGPRSLMVANFIPGFHAVATSLAGNMRVPISTFVFFDAIGAALYVGLGVGLGMLFRDAVDDVLDVLAQLGRFGAAVVVLAFALFIMVRWWQRQALIKELRMARITVPELAGLIDAGAAPVIIDVRAPLERLRVGAIPGALSWPVDDDGTIPELPRDTEIILYCACPNETSAARVAKRLQLQGFARVRPLYGGIDAWVRAGRPVDHRSIAGAAARSSKAATEV